MSVEVRLGWLKKVGVSAGGSAEGMSLLFGSVS